MVTAETALVIPALLAVTALLLWLVTLVAHQAQVVQAAREGARATARGDSVTEVVGIVQRQLPGARVEVARHGDRVVVTVTEGHVEAPRLLGALRRPLSASATTTTED